MIILCLYSSTCITLWISLHSLILHSSVEAMWGKAPYSAVGTKRKRRTSRSLQWQSTSKQKKVWLNKYILKRAHCAVGCMVVQWLALLLHSKRVLGLNPPAEWALLHVLSLCLHGFSPGTPAPTATIQMWGVNVSVSPVTDWQPVGSAPASPQPWIRGINGWMDAAVTWPGHERGMLSRWIRGGGVWLSLQMYRVCAWNVKRKDKTLLSEKVYIVLQLSIKVT